MSNTYSEKVQTTYGAVSVSISQPTAPQTGLSIILLHGNSSSSRIFGKLLEFPFTRSHAVYAIDFLGHGSSDHSSNPEVSYTQPGYARSVLEVINHYQSQSSPDDSRMQSIAILGWSLGGHAAIELIPLLSSTKARMCGLMLVGTPAIARGEVSKAFTIDPHVSAAFREELTPQEIADFPRSTVRDTYEQWMSDGVAKTDGRARRIMFEAMVKGDQSDQKAIVENTDICIAVINGAQERYIDLAYVDSIAYGNLWRNECFRVDDVGHAPFWEKPGNFEILFEAFIKDIDLL